MVEIASHNEGTKVHNPRHYNTDTVMYYSMCMCKNQKQADYVRGQIWGSIRTFGKALKVALAACCLG